MRLIDQLLMRDVTHPVVILNEQKRAENRSYKDTILTDDEVHEAMRRVGIDPNSDAEENKLLVGTYLSELADEIEREETKARQAQARAARHGRDLLAASAALAEFATVIDAQNVYRYLRSPAGHIDAYDLPCVAPKWLVTWVEYTQDNGQTIGVLAFYKEHGVDGESLRPDQGREATEEHPNGFRPSENGLWYSDHMPDLESWEDIRWCMNLSVFARSKELTTGPLTNWRVAISESGQIREMIWGDEERRPR